MEATIEHWVYIINPLPLDRDYSRDPNIQALRRRGFIHQGSKLIRLGGLDQVRVPQSSFFNTS